MKVKILLFLLLFINGNYGRAQSLNYSLFQANKPIKWGDYSTKTPAEKKLLLEASIVSDSMPTYSINVNDSNYIPPERFKTRFPQALIVPGVLIAYGLTTIRDNGLYSSYQARKDILKLTGGKGSNIDDYLIISPYLEFGALLLFKIQCRNDFTNTSLLIVKSELLMLTLTYSLKYLAHQERPYSYQAGLDGVPLDVRKTSGSAFQSMPSGHTAEAFVAATIVYREYRYLSPWYGVGAYTLATTVGVFRIINDQHWMSDVLVGAGIGMLSVNVVYATHQHRWGRNEICLFPLIDGQNRGLTFSCRF
jgi:membrane-associated phospholipid phosphatase